MSQEREDNNIRALLAKFRNTPEYLISISDVGLIVDSELALGIRSFASDKTKLRARDRVITSRTYYEFLQSQRMS